MTWPNPYPDEDPVYGPIIGANDIDLILFQLIDKWQLSYLHEIARRAGENVDELKPFRSHRVSDELEKMPEDQTPTLIIANMGISEPPMKTGTLRPGKSYGVYWRYQFGCLCSAKGSKISATPRANKLAKLYATAVRSILIQKRDDYRVLGMMDWIDEGAGELKSGSEDDRTIALWHTDFNVQVPNMAAWATGPLVPDLPDEPGDPNVPTWPWVISHTEDIVKVNVDEEVQ
jgi:hypothetical protein